jgi:hypothetical protein
MEKKTIKINPDLLKFGGTRSKRNRKTKTDESNENKHPKPIKMKKSANENNRSVRRRMMNHLREQQEENYRKMTNDVKPSSKSSKVTAIQAVEDFKSDFDKSLEYLENVTKKVETQPKPVVPLNKTSRYSGFNSGSNSGSVLQTPSILTKAMEQPFSNFGSVGTVTAPFYTCEDVQLDFPEDVLNPIVLNKPMFEQPKYGCLKYGGTLPTYRTWKTQTQRAYPTGSTNGGTTSGTNSNTNSNIKVEQKRQNLTQRHAEMRAFFKTQTKQKESSDKNERAKKYLKQKKQKRIMKRTFRVGKSKFHPRVSVLVSNQTMRNKVQHALSNLKNTPIEEVRKFLVKKGLIRVGSSCPNDVLRKMYESANLLCGEMQNHNPDNLLYNYLNHAEL